MDCSRYFLIFRYKADGGDLSLFAPYKKEILELESFKAIFREFMSFRATATNRSQQIQLRERINNKVGEIKNLAQQAGVIATVFYEPPPSVGGFAGNINMFDNIFLLDSHQLPRQNIIDVLDKAIGNYRYKAKLKRRRWLNPFFWIGEVIRIPFHIIKWAGFDSKKIEYSIFGKIYKVMVGTAALVGAIYKAISDLEGIVSFFKNLLVH